MDLFPLLVPANTNDRIGAPIRYEIADISKLGLQHRPFDLVGLEIETEDCHPIVIDPRCEIAVAARDIETGHIGHPSGPAVRTAGPEPETLTLKVLGVDALPATAASRPQLELAAITRIANDRFVLGIQDIVETALADKNTISIAVAIKALTIETYGLIDPAAGSGRPPIVLQNRKPYQNAIGVRQVAIRYRRVVVKLPVIASVIVHNIIAKNVSTLTCGNDVAPLGIGGRDVVVVQPADIDKHLIVTAVDDMRPLTHERIDDDIPLGSGLAGNKHHTLAIRR